jgi:hypothetical protein
LDKGQVKFPEVMKISLHSRIPNLTHVYGFQSMHKILMALLTGFSNSLNLIRPMTPEQIFDCSYELVMTSQEDQLSIEDYVLFFKGAKEGKYGRILDRMDQQTLFELLEQYRDQRHRALIVTREEQAAQHKTSLVNDRIADMFESEKEKMKAAQIDYIKSQPVGNEQD